MASLSEPDSPHTSAACQDATHRTCHHSFATQEEADKFIATYEAERCPCGGSPSWVEPRYQMHRADCKGPKP